MPTASCESVAHVSLWKQWLPPFMKARPRKRSPSNTRRFSWQTFTLLSATTYDTELTSMPTFTGAKYKPLMYGRRTSRGSTPLASGADSWRGGHKDECESPKVGRGRHPASKLSV